jgi:protein tyrosine phosphatase
VFQKESIYPDVVIRQLLMRFGRQQRLITQFHYTAWPDFGVPASTAGILHMLDKANETQKKSQTGPIVVHCSAGAGRTGTLIAIDINRQRAALEDCIDILDTLNKVRLQRFALIQSEDEYAFVYRALKDALSVRDTNMTPLELRKRCEQLSNVSRCDAKVYQEFDTLSSTSASPSLSDHAEATLSPNVPKNRDAAFVPSDKHRVPLVSVPAVAGSDYINATYVDGYKRRQAYIASQTPLDSAIPAFWQMIWEQRVSCIVNLLEPERCVEAERYWPTEHEPSCTHGPVTVQLISADLESGFVVRTLRLTHHDSAHERVIKQWQLLEWQQSNPSKLGYTLAKIVEASDVYSRSTVVLPRVEGAYDNQAAIGERNMLEQLTPMVVHCQSSAGRTGVFIAAVNCVERLQDENQMNAFQTVKDLWTQHSGFVSTDLEYALIYFTAMAWLDMQDTIRINDDAYSSIVPERVIDVLPAEYATLDHVLGVDTKHGATPGAVVEQFNGFEEGEVLQTSTRELVDVAGDDSSV